MKTINATIAGAVKNVSLEFPPVDDFTPKVSEKIGDAIGKACEWDNYTIAEIFYYALVESNDHKNAAKIKKMFDLEV